MKFTYLKKRFRGEGLDIWSNNGVYIGVGKQMLKLQNWEEARELFYKLDDIVGDALLSKRRMKYGKDLVIFPDEGQWTLWWKQRSISMSPVVLKQLPIALRFFCKKYHKLMLDYNNYDLKEGFSVETTNQSQRAWNATGL